MRFTKRFIWAFFALFALFAVDAYANVIISEVIETNEVCNLSNGTLTIIIDGDTTGLQYSIDNGITFQSSNFFDNLEAADYLIIVSDGTACSDIFVAQISDAETPEVTYSVECVNGNNLVDIDLVAFSSGIAPFDYQWSFSGTTQSTEDLFNVPPGQFSVTITDRLGCSTDTTFQVPNCCVMEVFSIPDSTMISCLGDYNELTTEVFDTLTQEDLRTKLDTLLNIQIGDENCNDLTVSVESVSTVPSTCAETLEIQTSIFITDGVSTDTTLRYYFIESHLNPIIECPQRLEVEPSISLESDVELWLADISIIDACSQLSFSNDFDLSQITLDCNGTTVPITVTALDVCGGSSNCIAELVLLNGGQAAISCPSDTIIECSDDILQHINDWVSQSQATDFQLSPVAVTNTIDENIINSVVCDSTMSIVFTASTLCDSSNCSAQLQIGDFTAPTITCPDDLSIAFNAANFSQDVEDWLATVSATDNCSTFDLDNSYAFTQVDCLGGMEVVTFTATDLCQNENSCTATILISGGEDGEISCPSSLLLDCGSNDAVSEINIWLDSATAFVGLEEQVIVNNFDDSFLNQSWCSVSQQILFSSDSPCGTLSCTSMIELSDAEGPFIICPVGLDINIEEINNENIVVSWLTEVVVSDACSAVTSDNSYTLGTTSTLDCGDSLEVVFEATDDCGNTSSCQSLIRITDDNGPLLTCPDPLDIACDDLDQDTYDDWIAEAISIDANGDLLAINTPITYNDALSLVCGDDLAVSFDSGNGCSVSSCVSTISVDDTESPTIICPLSLEITIGSSDAIDLITDWSAETSADDNCGQVDISSDLDLTVFDNLCDLTSPILISYTAEDACNNLAFCESNIIIIEQADNLQCPEPLIIQCGDDMATEYIEQWLSEVVNSTDNNFDNAMITDNCTSELLITFEGDDLCQETISCTSLITIIDDESPELLCPDVLEIDMNLLTDAVFMDWLNSYSAYDSCGDVDLDMDFDFTIDNLSCGDIESIAYRAVDECGNEATCTTQLILESEVDLSLSCPESFTIECSESVLEFNALSNIVLDNIIIEGEEDYLIAYDFDTELSDLDCDQSYQVGASILVTHNCHLDLSCQIVIDILPEVSIYVPNVFTPTQGTNNRLTVYANEVVEVVSEFYIFDRWGNLLYEAFDFTPNDEQKGWNGIYKNVNPESSVYTYKAVLKTVTGETIEQVGNFLILN